jgi:hypothetical protein
VCFPFLDSQDEVGPSISSSVVLCSLVILVYIVVLVLVFYLCPSFVSVKRFVIPAIIIDTESLTKGLRIPGNKIRQAFRRFCKIKKTDNVGIT